MALWTYSIANFFSIQSGIELLLLDNEVEDSEADVRIHEGNVPRENHARKIGDGEHYEFFVDDSRQSVIDDRRDDGRAEIRQASGSIEIRVSPEYAQLNSKQVPFPRAGFTKLLLSTIQYRLLQENATMAFGTAAESPDGRGILLFAGGETGKSTVLFRLATEHDYHLLADDIVIFHKGDAYPFPRYADLPVGVDAIEQEVNQLCEEYKSKIQDWPKEVSVPRQLISSIPPIAQPEYSFFLNRNWIPFPHHSGIQVEQGQQMAVDLNKNHARNWTTYEPVRHFFDRYSEGGVQDNRDELIQEAIKGTTCHKLTTMKKDLIPQTITDIVEAT